VENKESAGSLKQLCDTAREKGILIIASARGPEHRIYPACFSNVVGAYRHPDCAWDDLMFHAESLVAFGAHGFPRPIPGLPQEKNGPIDTITRQLNSVIFVNRSGIA